MKTEDERAKPLHELLVWLQAECVWPSNAIQYADRWTNALESVVNEMNPRRFGV